MSDIQTTINYYLSKEGGPLRTITITDGSGSASLPSNCYLHLRKCNIGTLTVSRDCVVVIEESTLQSVVMESGSLTIDRTTVSGKIQIDSVKTTTKLCSFSDTVDLKNGSSLDSYKCNRTGASIAISANDNCRITLREDSITACETGIEMKNGCFLSSRNCNIVVVLRAVRGSSNCQVEVLGGKLNGEEGFCVDLDGSSTGVLSGIENNLVANRAAISLKSSTIRMVNCKGINSVEFGVIAEDNSSVVIYNFENLKTSSDAVFKLDSGSSAEVSKGDNIFSSGNDTILLKDSTFTARKINKIYSPAKNAFFSQGGSTVVLSDIFVEVRGYGNRAIEAQENDNYSVSKVPLIQGDAAEAIKTGNKSNVSLFEIDKVIGNASHAIDLGNECKLSMKKISLVQGVTGHGINAGNSSTIVSSEVETIKGLEGSGINLGKTSVLRYANGKLIHGLMLHGVATGNKSDVEIRDFVKVIGEKEDGVYAPASVVTLLDGDKVIGQILNGVDVSGSGGKVIVRRVNEIFGVESDGLRLHKGEVDARDFGGIKGGISGINATSSLVVAERGEMVKGWEAGIRAGDGTRAIISSLDLLYGAGEGAINARDSTVEVTSVKVVEAAPFAIDSLNSKVVCKQCEIKGGILAEGSSAVLVDRCSLEGKSVEVRESELTSIQCDFTSDFTIDGSSFNATNTILDGIFVGNSSEFDFRKVEIKNVTTLTDSSVKGSKVVFTGLASFTDVGGLFANSQSEGLALVNSGVVASLCSFDPVGLVESGYINIDPTKTHISHELLIDLVAAEIVTDGSA